MDQAYWITEYVKLFLAYGFTLYVWPSVVFREHLRNRSRAYRFAFCALAPVLLCNTGVLLLGLMHLLRPWVTSLLFFGVFFLKLAGRLAGPARELLDWVRRLSAGNMTRRRFLLRCRTAAGDWLRSRVSPWWAGLRGRRLEYGLLLLLLAFGTLYFSWGAFDEHVYGCGDQYVHHAWIYGLTQGKAFSGGIYPEGMHCVIYLVCTGFGISLYSGVLFFAGLQIPVLLVSAWLFMRTVFRWRYTPLVVLAMYLTFDQLCIVEVTGMARLSWTLPLEYGMYSQYLCAAFLLRFFRRVRRGEGPRASPRRPREWGRVLLDPDLLPFALAVSVSLAVHFYVTIIAFFFCFSVALVSLRMLLRRGSLLPLAAMALAGVFLAVLPIGVAAAAGYPWQGSMGWAMEVMAGQAEEQPQTEGTLPDLPAEEEAPPPDSGEPQETVPPPDSRLLRLLRGGAAWLRRVPRTLLDAGYRTLYPGIRGSLVLGATLFALLTAGGMHLFLQFRALRQGRKRRALPEQERQEARAPEEKETGLPPDCFAGSLATAILSVLLMLMYCAGSLGLPQLVAGARLCSTEQLVLLMLYALPLDCLFLLPGRRLSPELQKSMAAALCLGVYVLARSAGIFHGYLYFDLTRYGAAVETTRRILEDTPRQMFTVVSNTDEYYQVVEDGYHEELLTLLQREQDPGYTIPTPYIYLFVEKRPIVYAQHHFAAGPAWLANNRYAALFSALKTTSRCPEILGGSISPEAAERGIKYGAKLSDTASDPEGRVILESKAWRWMQRFQELYPNEGRIIYEDGDFLCYCIIQNPNSLYPLGLFASG